MVRHVCLLGVAWILLGSDVGAKAPTAVDDSGVLMFLGELDSQVTSLMREFEVPGAAVGVIHNGRVVFRKGFGVASTADSVPVSSSTMFNAGSISKSVTAWAILSLANDGRLDLDAPVSTYIKRWQLPPSGFHGKF